MVLAAAALEANDLGAPSLSVEHERKRFDASPHRRGVGEYPRRGFETATFAYEGEIEHRDSAAGGTTPTTAVDFGVN